jgi:tRNA nucleotidyltransferase (CCA-adding enzyme)
MSRDIQVITTHINADFDGLASMLAAKKLYPEARVVFPGAQERSLRDFLVQSTFYLFETDRIRDIDLDRVGTLILVDTRDRSRIGRFAEIVDCDGVAIHIYDHHPPCDDDLQGHKEIIREVGANTTLMVEILRENRVQLSPDEATILALGIYEDTGSLTFSSTTEADFLAMAYLRSRGANLSVVSDLITRELTAEQVFLLNDLVRSVRKIRIQGVEIVIATASSEHYVGDFAVLVHKLRDMENIDVLFAVALMEDRVYLVARSRLEAVNVGRIAHRFGGGGHATAASATVRNLTLIQVEERLLQLLEDEVRPLRTARDIMSFPVMTIQSAQRIREAEEILARFNINVLPVMEDGTLVGLISRVVVQRAAYHGLEALPAGEYMTTDFVTAEPWTPVEEVRRRIVENAQRFLPILEEGRLVGAVTRTDILRDLEFNELGESSAVSEIREKDGARKKDIRRIMQERLPGHIVGLKKNLGRVAEEMGYNAYVVGGFVRDLLLGQENLDIDIVVEGNGIEFARRYAENHDCRYRAHQKFRTAVLIFPDDFKVDVATARTEYYAHPAALPTVERGSIKLDLYRRDFTINTLAIRINPSPFGQLLDFFGGQRDIKDRTVRVLHNLSFVEDPTRILRAVRFEQRFGFRIGKQTLNLIQNAVRMNFLERVEGRRLWHELWMLLNEKRPIPGLQRLAELDVVRFIHPKMDCASDEKMALFMDVEGVLAWFSLLYLEEEIENWRVYLFAMLDHLTDKEVRQALRRLNFVAREIDNLSGNKYQADRTIGRLTGEKDRSPSAVYRMLTPFTMETLLYMIAKARDRHTKRYVARYITDYRNVRPLLNGRDLKRLGLKPGPIFKKTLELLRDARLDGKLKTKQDEVAFVRRKIQGGN